MKTKKLLAFTSAIALSVCSLTVTSASAVENMKNYGWSLDSIQEVTEDYIVLNNNHLTSEELINSYYTIYNSGKIVSHEEKNRNLAIAVKMSDGIEDAETYIKNIFGEDVNITIASEYQTVGTIGSTTTMTNLSDMDYVISSVSQDKLEELTDLEGFESIYRIITTTEDANCWITPCTIDDNYYVKIYADASELNEADFLEFENKVIVEENTDTDYDDYNYCIEVQMDNVSDKNSTFNNAIQYIQTLNNIEYFYTPIYQNMDSTSTTSLELVKNGATDTTAPKAFTDYTLEELLDMTDDEICALTQTTYTYTDETDSELSALYGRKTEQEYNVKDKYLQYLSDYQSTDLNEWVKALTDYQTAVKNGTATSDFDTSVLANLQNATTQKVVFPSAFTNTYGNAMNAGTMTNEELAEYLGVPENAISGYNPEICILTTFENGEDYEMEYVDVTFDVTAFAEEDYARTMAVIALYMDADLNPNVIQSDVVYLLKNEDTTPNGDISSDGVIDVADAFLCLNEVTNISAGLDSSFTTIQTKAADVDGNGTLDFHDAYCILQYATQISAGLTVDWASIIG